MNILGQVLREAREQLEQQLQREISEGDIAAELRQRHIPMERKTWSNLETGRTKTIKPDVAKEVAKILPISVRQMVLAMGYEVELGDDAVEAGSALLDAYVSSTVDRRQIALLALMPNLERSGDPRLALLRRLAATDRQDRRETQE